MKVFIMGTFTLSLPLHKDFKKILINNPNSLNHLRKEKEKCEKGVFE
tara:strand:+ start:359 stop:499 length:141 start_codon:yes stop_codon:yes gene_type:complete